MAATGYSGCYNCCFTGDQGVGKTSLAVTKSTKEYPTKHEHTVFENYAADISVGNQKFLLGLFDNASQPCYEPLRAWAYEKSDVFLLCYSVANRSSFLNLKTVWVPELGKYISKKKPVIVLGLQVDLRTDSADCVSTEEGTQLAKDIGAVNFLECSALTKTGMHEVFDEVIRLMVSSKKKKNTFAVFRSLRQQVMELRAKTTKGVCRLLSPKPKSVSTRSLPRTPPRKVRFSIG